MLLLAVLIGVVAGLRALTAPAVVAWAAVLDWINLAGTWVSWIAHPVTVIIFTVLAVGELVTDKLPMTPSRTAVASFIARILLGPSPARLSAPRGLHLGWARRGHRGCGTGHPGRLHGTDTTGRRHRRPRPAGRAGRRCGRSPRRVRGRGDDRHSLAEQFSHVPT
ncbi:hypothetical protein I553_5997 [Mycobacterium xenopi 4042]|uniref:DUF4126 domain-containing protein n=1 Tax=Mycobacterium xenopi 4042 TaxID=1299334 RepID=X8BDB4_MYCXE|nr:hypothetical protein I553_5997 [Mycobacterium xenopi 4042]